MKSDPDPSLNPFDSTRPIESRPFEKASSHQGTLHPEAEIILPPNSIAEDPPTRIDQYEILRPLGRGGMGEVFLAYDSILKRHIALKRIRSDRKEQSDLRSRFANEARVTAMLQHPSVIPVYSFSSKNNDLFYTMRPVEGMTLGDIMEKLQDNDEQAWDEWTVQHLIRLFLQATGAIAFAHARSVIHRDLKPSNIMIGPFEEVLVLDWGLAKILGGAVEEEAAYFDPADWAITNADTASQMLVGTPGYIPREQLEMGMPHSPQSDVFALGVILYELLSLRKPWSGKTLAALTIAMGKSPPNPVQLQPRRDIPAPLAEVALRAIHPTASKRYQSVSEFAHDVAHALEGRASWQTVEHPSSMRPWQIREGRAKTDDNKVLTFHSAGRKQEFLYQFTLPLFPGDLRLEFNLRVQKGAHKLSVVMNCPDLRKRDEIIGYQFEVLSGKRKILALLRNGRDVAGARSPDLEPNTWYGVAIERIGDTYSISMGGEILYSYTDPIPVRGGYLALLGSSLGLSIKNLQLFSRGASSSISCLAVPDTFFNKRLLKEARQEYLRIAKTLPGRREGRIAGFRAGLCLLETAMEKKDPRVRDELLQEAHAGFLEQGRQSPSCLSGLGQGIVASRQKDFVRMRAALEEALTVFREDPHLDTLKEWLLSFLHGTTLSDRKALAECLPLAVDHCFETANLRVLREMVHRLRADWEIPSFFSGRLQGKLADPAFRAEIRLYFGFWTARADFIMKAAQQFFECERIQPYHVEDVVFALFELDQPDKARDMLQLLETHSPPDAERANFQSATSLCHCALLAHENQLSEARRLIRDIEPNPANRGYNAARLAMARAAYRSGKTSELFDILKGTDRHDTFTREHRAWFSLQISDHAAASRELAPLIARGSHKRGRNLTNFLHGLCHLGERRHDRAHEVFGLLPFHLYPRTWTLGSHYASGRLTGERLTQYTRDAFPWEQKHLFAQCALLAQVKGDEEGMKELLGKSQAACRVNQSSE